jgi:short-subunit dehydrogenase
MTQSVAIVTGASRGIGKAVAELLANKNYLVILISRNKKLLEQNCNQITSTGKKATYFVVDVTDLDQIKNCIQSVISDYNQINLLFNNAGIAKVGTTEITDQDIIETLDTNLKGALFFAKHVALQMKKQRSGYIMNLSSTYGKVGSATLGAYNASKFGLSGFSEALSKEMTAYGVKVTAICPSFVATDMTQGFDFDQNQMIQTSDICQTVDYLLKLSPNALPLEICIECAPFLTKMAEAETKIFVSD